MINRQICNNCGTENPLFALTCKSCRHYLRDRVVNLDLGNFVYKLMEEPIITLKKVIFAEHKNYSVLFFVLLILKTFFISFVLRNFLPFQKFDLNYFYIYFLNIAGYFIALFVLWNIVVFLFHKLFGIKEKLRDNFAVSVFSGSPLVLSLVILTPIELALFGFHWFIFNPSPFFLFNTAAYVLYGLEALFLFWGIILYCFQYYVRSGNIIYSIPAGIVTFALLYGVPVILPVFNFID